jgi:hypothetical protein
MKTIQIPENTTYLSEVISDFPSNCIFDKGRIGAGCTTLAITNAENYVIVVPFVSLVENKERQHSSQVIGVYSNTKDAAIKRYIKSRKEAELPVKILVTSDSLPRVTALLLAISEDLLDYSILIDEYHLLFTQYPFRKDAVKGVLAEYTKYKKFCFVTATILQEEFILEELKDIEVVKAEWIGTKLVTVKSTKCTKDVIKSVAYLVNQFLAGNIDGNAYIFVNSVQFIKDLVKICDLSDDNARAIWSKNNKTETGLSRGNVLDPPKKINLLTSTVFEGTDIYDEEGRIYIVSDKTKSHTLTDISTSFQQIAGRIRNSKYWDTITHYYTTTRYDAILTYEDFKEFSDKTIEEAKQLINEGNNLSDLARKKFSLDLETYVCKEEDTFLFDPNLVKLDLYNYRVTKCLYKLRVNVNREYEKYHLDYEDVKLNNKEVALINIDDLGDNFTECIQTLKSIYQSDSKEDKECTRFLLNKYTWFSELAAKLGIREAIELAESSNFDITTIKRKALKHLDTTQESKVKNMLRTYSDISIGVFISSSRSKEILQEVYQELGVKSVAKGTDIKKFLTAKERNKRQKGELVKGFVVLAI